MSEPKFRSALAGAAKINGTISVSAVNDRGMIDLRGDLNDSRFTAAVKKVLSQSLPGTPRSSAAKDDISVLWLSVDQWLITCPRARTAALLTALNKALTGIHSLVVDVSDARSIIRLEGQGAREVLMKGAPVDLTTQEYERGYVRRLRFAELAALVHIVSDQPDILDLYVFRSYADYVWNWLAATSTQAAKLEIFFAQDRVQI
jgi:sarcosine oxidase subunit gamma